MRVAAFPDWRRENPYQRLLAEALGALGVEVAFPQGYRRVLPLARAVLPRPRPNLLHLHWPSAYLRSDRTSLRTAYCLRTLADVALVRRAGIPVIWTVHNLVTHDTPTPRVEYWFPARLANLADGLIVHSDEAAEEAAATLTAPRDKITVIPHGSFLQAYGPRLPRPDARTRLGLPMDRRVALFFGMIRPYKGIPKLLAAWASLGARRDDAILIIAGSALDPHYAARIQELAGEVADVRLDLRYIPDDEVPALISAADVLVLPFEKSLSSGTVRLANDFGVPVVVPRSAGAGTTTATIRAESSEPEELGAAILRGLRSPRTSVGTNGCDDWQAIAGLHCEVFAKAVAHITG